MADVTVRRVDFGYFIRPAEETGMGVPRVEPCLGYAVGHPEGIILFDTGMGSCPEVDAHYRPRRVGLPEALAAVGAQISDLRLAANCHLHVDHCGGNPLLGQIPVFVQETELGAARQAPDYTLPELIDGSRFEQVTGQVEMLPGVFLMPTPGHTDGHQSLIVRRPDGAVIVAGHLVDSSPLSTIGALCIASAPLTADRRLLFNQVLIWGLSMAVVGAGLCYLLFGLS